MAKKDKMILVRLIYKDGDILTTKPSDFLVGYIHDNETIYFNAHFLDGKLVPSKISPFDALPNLERRGLYAENYKGIN